MTSSFIPTADVLRANLRFKTLSKNVIFIKRNSPKRKRSVLNTTNQFNFHFWDWAENETPKSFHGVLHSTMLPAALTETVGVFDARDAIEACDGLWGEEKAACYAVFGVAPGADEWFDVVYRMEMALELETTPEEDGLHHGQERC